MKVMLGLRYGVARMLWCNSVVQLRPGSEQRVGLVFRASRLPPWPRGTLAFVSIPRRKSDVRQVFSGQSTIAGMSRRGRRSGPQFDEVTLTVCAIHPGLTSGVYGRPYVCVPRYASRSVFGLMTRVGLQLQPGLCI